MGISREPRKSRRSFLKAAAGLGAGTVLAGPAFVQGSRAAAAAESLAPFPRIDPRLMITPQEAWDWNMFKAQGGPTYAGSTGWKRYTDFLIAKMREFGAVDLDHVEIPTTITSWTIGRIGARMSMNRARRSRSSSAMACRCRWSPPTA
jgi:hypothetical protein